MRIRIIMMLGVLLCSSTLYSQEKILTIEEMKRLVVQQNLVLKALSKDVKAAEGRVLQSSLRINPEFELESGTGGDPETVAKINQTIQLGGKRSKRIQVSELEMERARLNYEIAKQDILKEAISSFIDLLVSQQSIKLFEEKVAVSKEFLASVQERVTAGRLSPAEESRSQVTLASNQIELNSAKRSTRSLRKKLASFWGSTSPVYSIVVGRLDADVTTPDSMLLNQSIEASPRIVEKELSIKLAQATTKFERALRIPDLTLSGGFKRVEGIDNTYEVGISIPIPLFDKNQGAVREAIARQEQAEEERRALEVQIKIEVFIAYTELQTAYEEIQALKTSILPGAGRANSIINDGYLQGKFAFLDVIEAQNTLFEARENLLIGLSEYHKAVAELERILGRSVTSNINLEQE